MEMITLGEVGSTNAEALRLWRARASGGTALAVMARTQTAGVGRSGRAWKSPEGGVWMTVAWPVKDAARYAGVSLVVGGAVRAVLAREAGLECQIKWPNDVLVKGKKLAGILCRMEEGCLLMGVGINVAFDVEALGAELRMPATTVLGETGRHVDVEALGRAVADEMERAVRALEKDGLEAQLGRIRKHLAWVGAQVVCADYGEQPLASGIFRGVDAAGRALIDGGGEWRAVDAGELHFSRVERG